MTARERVVTALGHRKPDRLPRYEIFLPDYVARWRKERGLPKSANIYDAYPRIDIGTVLATQEGPFLARKAEMPGEGDAYYRRDSWGRLTRHSRSGTFFEVQETVLHRKGDLDTLRFEDPNDPGRYARLVKRERSVHDRFAPVSGVMGLFMPSYYLRGELELLTDLAEDEPFCRALAGKVADFITAVGENALRCTNTWDTAIWVYDELGNNKSSVMSPRTFANVFLEPYRRMIARWKSLGARNVVLHCDGNCLPLLDLLIEAGFTGLQGVNPTAGMTVPAVKARYGSRLALIGGMCNILVLAKGSRRDIERNVMSIVEVAREGGVIIGTHSIDVDVPTENYDAYCEFLERAAESW